MTDQKKWLQRKITWGWILLFNRHDPGIGRCHHRIGVFHPAL